MLNWALRAPTTHAQLLERITTGRGRVEVRYEPARERAVALARGLRWIEVDDRGWLVLTDAGSAVTDDCTELGLYESERGVLSELPTGISQSLAQSILHDAL